jgi:hypothetical protein
MENIKDVNISIGKDKIQTGVIFLSGFVAGGITIALTMKSRLEKMIIRKDRQKSIETAGMAEAAVNRAYCALDRLTDRAAALEASLNNETATINRLKMEEK